ncbi:hypothetical protein [Rhodopila sp.]|uniref:hypothetical protein n=1 Tax=Rhodopila sp. TaxID=2480087 RepID=UPI003D1235A4
MLARVLLLAVMTLMFSVAAIAASTNGDKYCIDNNSTTFLARHLGNELEFSLSSWSGRGHYFGISGVATPEVGGEWVFHDHMDSPKLDARCEAHIRAQPAGGYTFWLTQAGPCSESQGFSFQSNAKVVFPAWARRGGIAANKTMEQAASPEAGGEWCR